MKPTDDLAIARLPLSEEVYQRLQHHIITLRFAPGEKVNDQALAEMFGVSRTPVREALKRLEEEGLIFAKRGSRTIVTELDAEQAQQTYPIIATLHGLAARLAGPVLTKDDVTELQTIHQQFTTAIDQQDTETALTLDDAFHDVFVKRSQNAQLGETIRRLTPLIRRLEYAQFDQLGRQSIADHAAILVACEQRDVEQLVQATEHNWNGLGRLLVSTLKEES
ncbi:GntR family transcriptional regulator [Exiguobacterium sp. s168]|uniref:GntR family transcriptional regulator n=1 Tax=Exiguobacterium sp. s168 TaxID=2751194 RepID=UPI001BE842B5|nr:GntR family transcriptional regulator [Exiguobacterium sp. s168]